MSQRTHTFCEAPLSNPRSHNALTPVGSSSMSSLTSGGRRTKKMFPNLSAPVKHEDVRNTGEYQSVYQVLLGGGGQIRPPTVKHFFFSLLHSHYFPTLFSDGIRSLIFWIYMENEVVLWAEWGGGLEIREALGSSCLSLKSYSLTRPLPPLR